MKRVLVVLILISMPIVLIGTSTEPVVVQDQTEPTTDEFTLAKKYEYVRSCMPKAGVLNPTRYAEVVGGALGAVVGASLSHYLLNKLPSLHNIPKVFELPSETEGLDAMSQVLKEFGISKTKFAIGFVPSVMFSSSCIVAGVAWLTSQMWRLPSDFMRSRAIEATIKTLLATDQSKLPVAVIDLLKLYDKTKDSEKFIKQLQSLCELEKICSTLSS